MKIINIVLALVVVGLAYLLWDVINAPIEFNKLKEKRYDAVETQLEDIKTAQLKYKELHSKFADDFNQLIRSVKNDSIPIYKVIGNPDDTTVEVQRDTLYEPFLTSVFYQDYPIDSLAFVPQTDGKKFSLSAGEITKNKVTVKVFEVYTTNEDIFHNVSEKRFFVSENRFVLGSMQEATFGIKRPLE